MSDALTPQNLKLMPTAATGSPPLELDQIQGDVLIGLQKFIERFIFFEIRDAKAFKVVLRRSIADRITTTRTVQLREFQLRDYKNHGNMDPVPNVGVNVAFTNDGVQKLTPGANLNEP